MSKIIVDDNFIRKWHPEYDKIEDDEKEYQEIVKIARKEKLEKEAISKITFGRMLRWKTPRVMGIVKFDEFEIYDRELRKCLDASENAKLIILDKLYGIGAPVASTILHFIYPNEFPIMDIRTVEALHEFGYIESKIVSPKRYVTFRSIVLNIHKQYLRWSLREIDRALFAYHKISRGYCSCRHRNKIKKCCGA